MQYYPRNRLMRVAVDGATVARHTYDGEGVRTKRLDANGTIHYVGRRYERNVGNGANLPDVGTTYIEAQLGARTVLLAFRKGGQLTVVGTDHLGGTLATAAGTGGLPVTGRLRYTPYGQGLGASGNFGTDRGFTGQTVDAMAGLYWFASRSYDPSIGRFVQPDSVVPDWASPQALNRYAYALNNPLRYVDPSGHATILPDARGTGVVTDPMPPSLGGKTVNDPVDLIRVTPNIFVVVGPTGPTTILDEGVPQRPEPLIFVVTPDPAGNRGTVREARRDGNLLDEIARQRGLDKDERQELGRAVEEEKRQVGRGNTNNISRREIEAIADDMFPEKPAPSQRPDARQRDDMRQGDGVPREQAAGTLDDGSNER